MNIFGQVLNFLLLENNVSEVTFANALNIPIYQFSNILSGDFVPDDELVQKMKDILIIDDTETMLLLESYHINGIVIPTMS